MLWLIGLGLQKGDISLRGLDVIAKADIVAAEGYTSSLPCSLSELERFLQKPIRLLNREELEDKAEDFVALAKSKQVVLLIPGDPLIATTHYSLVQLARKAGISCEILHSSSIATAAARTGLHAYKFGKTASIPFPKGSFFPESPYLILQQNLSIAAHTLLLLDCSPRQMTIAEGIEILLELEKRFGLGAFTPETKCIGAAALTSENEKIVYAEAKRLKGQAWPAGPCCLIVPAQLHFTEEEALQSYVLS